MRQQLAAKAEGGGPGGGKGGGEAEEGGNKPSIARKPYQFLLVSVLREYLALELKVGVAGAAPGGGGTLGRGLQRKGLRLAL